MVNASSRGHRYVTCLIDHCLVISLNVGVVSNEASVMLEESNS